MGRLVLGVLALAAAGWLAWSALGDDESTPPPPPAPPADKPVKAKEATA